MKVFCPQIGAICTDGFPGDHQCVMWDADKKACLFAEHMKLTVDVLTRQSQLWPSKRPSDDKLQELLKDVKLSEEL